MYSLANLVAGRQTRTYLTISLLCLVAAGCAGDDPMSGTWRQTDATTELPPELGGGVLDIDATVALDGLASPEATFNIDMNLAAMGLTDVIQVEGTYFDDGTNLTLTISGFVIDPASGNTSSVIEGMQCITLTGFAGTPVCFPPEQTHAYTVADDTLSLVLDHSIAGNPVSQTHFTFARVQ
jgi:hypothetical protein